MAARRTSLVAALALTLLAAPAAHADTFDKLYADYQKDGAIDACRYSAAELKKAKSQVPSDIEAYAPDFPDALDAATEKRAGNGCAAATTTATTTAAAAPATTTPTAAAGAGAATTDPAATTADPAAAAPAPTTTPAPAADPTADPAAADGAIAKSAASDESSDAGAPAVVILLAIVGGLLALGGLLYAAARWFAWDPAWARSGRHALAEAGWRASATWAEFTDWVRFGR